MFRLISTHECISSLTLQHITRAKDREGNILQQVSNNVIRMLVNKLKFLSLKCRISRLQIKQIFAVIAAGQSNLEELYEKLSVGAESHFLNGINMSVWGTNYAWGKLREKVERNSFYSCL